MARQAAETVEALLGIDANGENVHLGLANAIVRRLSISALHRLAGVIARDEAQFKPRLIPKTTLERRKKSATRHSTSEGGDRLARLAKDYVFALEDYRDSRNAREFLKRPRAMLDGKPPFDVALATSPGADA